MGLLGEGRRTVPRPEVKGVKTLRLACLTAMTGTFLFWMREKAARRALMTDDWCKKKQTQRFLAEPGALLLMFAGKVVWRQPQPPGLPSTTPVLSLPDLDGDKVGEVALVMSDSSQVNLAGKSGRKEN